MEAPREIFERAVAAHRAGDLAAAEAGYRQVLTASPQAAPAHHNLVALLRSAQRFEELEPAYRALLAIEPEGPHAFLRAVNLLRLGRYAEAWPGWEQRPSKAPSAPQGRTPEWRGEPLAGKRLLVWEEQGLGDQIQMARYIPRLQAQGAQVWFACSEPLRRLLGALCPTTPRRGRIEGSWDYWVPSLSLPTRFATTLETVPPPAPLVASRSGRGLGVKTRGAPAHPEDAQRSLPQSLAERLLALPGAVDLDPAATGATDLQATAEIVAGLERVVSVDTAVAHLAASMGKPTTILVPADWPDWRWGLRRDDSPWYPSARLLRQATPGDWTETVERLERDLR